METTQKIFGEPWPEFNDGLYYNDVVSPNDSGMSIMEYYSTKYNNSAPKQGWLQRIQSGQIKVDGKVTTNPSTILSVGSELVYHRLPWKEPDAPYLIEVLYEDDDMIALNKPSGLQVLPGGLFQQRTVLFQLKWRQSKLNALLCCQESHPVPVHRLGRGTSGILLCAKSKLAKSRFAAYFADGTSFLDKNSTKELRSARKITKIYRAIVKGLLNEDKVVIRQPIGLIKYPGVAKGLHVASPSGKLALSKVEVLERDNQRNCTIVQVEIQSGRPHQIRIHLSYIGHPLLEFHFSGDPLYAGGGQPRCSNSEALDECFAEDGGYQRPENPVPGDCGYFLHAHKLTISHPISDMVIKLTAPLPPLLQVQGENTSKIS